MMGIFHRRTAWRIRTGELMAYRFEDDYPGVGECLLLYFKTRPFIKIIKPRHWYYYIDHLYDWQMVTGAEDDIWQAVQLISR